MSTKRNFSIFENSEPRAKKLIRDSNGTENENEEFINEIKIWSWNVAGLRACVKVCTIKIFQL